jgi:hypothetical protein
MNMQPHFKRGKREMKMPIKELKSVEFTENEYTYYFNEEMLEDGIFIKYNTYEFLENELDEVESSVSYIEVGCMIENGKDVEAEYYILYWDAYLPGIQIYRIIKDFYEIYANNSKSEFIEFMRELSSQYRSSSMQSKKEHRESLIDELQNELLLIKDLDLMGTSYFLLDTEGIENLPTSEELNALKKYDMVKVIIGEGSKTPERMWVKILTIKGDVCKGELHNYPYSLKSITSGDILEFNLKHIIAIG